MVRVSRSGYQTGWSVTRKKLEDFWYEEHRKEGYQFCQTPIMLSKELWEISGHWNNYKNNMYTSKIDDKEYAIKPMNCPGGILIYNSTMHSYRDLPLRLGELGHVHHHEASGALNGLFRVLLDDAHIFCTPDQLEAGNYPADRFHRSNLSNLEISDWIID